MGSSPTSCWRFLNATRSALSGSMHRAPFGRPSRRLNSSPRTARTPRSRRPFEISLRWQRSFASARNSESAIAAEASAVGCRALVVNAESALSIVFRFASDSCQLVPR